MFLYNFTAGERYLAENCNTTYCEFRALSSSVNDDLCFYYDEAPCHAFLDNQTVCEAYPNCYFDPVTYFCYENHPSLGNGMMMSESTWLYISQRQLLCPFCATILRRFSPLPMCFLIYYS